MKTMFSILGGFLTAILVIAAALCVSVNSLIEQYGSNYIVPSDRLPQVDAIIIPGAKINADNTPSQSLKNRLDQGYELYQKGYSDKILVSGDHSSPYYNEVEVMLNYLEDLGVPGRDIFVDHSGFDTYDTMYRAANVYEVSNAIVVSQHYHTVRAVYIGHQLGIHTYGVDAAESETANAKWMNLREYGARLKAFFQAGILKPESEVLEEPISIFSDGTVTHDQ